MTKVYRCEYIHNEEMIRYLDIEGANHADARRYAHNYMKSMRPFGWRVKTIRLVGPAWRGPFWNIDRERLVCDLPQALITAENMVMDQYAAPRLRVYNTHELVNMAAGFIRLSFMLRKLDAAIEEA